MADLDSSTIKQYWLDKLTMRTPPDNVAILEAFTDAIDECPSNTEDQVRELSEA